MNWSRWTWCITSTTGVRRRRNSGANDGRPHDGSITASTRRRRASSRRAVCRVERERSTASAHDDAVADRRRLLAGLAGGEELDLGPALVQRASKLPRVDLRPARERVLGVAPVDDRHPPSGEWGRSVVARAVGHLRPHPAATRRPGRPVRPAGRRERAAAWGTANAPRRSPCRRQGHRAARAPRDRGELGEGAGTVAGRHEGGPGHVGPGHGDLVDPGAGGAAAGRAARRRRRTPRRPGPRRTLRASSPRITLKPHCVSEMPGTSRRRAGGSRRHLRCGCGSSGRRRRSRRARGSRSRRPRRVRTRCQAASRAVRSVAPSASMNATRSASLASSPARTAAPLPRRGQCTTRTGIAGVAAASATSAVRSVLPLSTTRPRPRRASTRRAVTKRRSARSVRGSRSSSLYAGMTM